jgi:3'(2'), 5'-bisphosphate nucleotidase
MDLEKLLVRAKSAAKNASEEILNIYESGDFSIQAKADNSPLTLADRAAHYAIVSVLEETGIPVLSEEGKEIPYQERKDWEYFWMIDPLDGTKEFIKRNGEFTVNIALIHKGRPILGVVEVPVQKKLYFAIEEGGAYLESLEGITKLLVNNFRMEDANLRVVASRSHLNEETEKFLNNLNNPEIVSMGSSLKLLAVAEGLADLYPRFAPTMEWDTAAAHIIVEEAGGKTTKKDNLISLEYNKVNLLNPFFIVTGGLI